MSSKPTKHDKHNTADSDKPDASGWSASLHNKNAPFVYSPAFTAQPGERIIDFGCGSGEVEIQKRVEGVEGGLLVGLDFSESMVRYIKVIVS